MLSQRRRAANRLSRPSAWNTPGPSALGGCSFALCARLLALRGGAPEPQTRAVVRYPPVGTVLGPAKGRDAIRPGQPRPRGAKLGQDAIDGGGPRERARAWLDGPHLAVRLRPREAVLLHEAGRLTGEGEHTAATIARPYPARAPRSEASPAVEEQQDACGTKRGRIGPHGRPQQQCSWPRQQVTLWRGASRFLG